MKLSCFNSALKIEGKHTLLYNSFSGKFIVVKDRIVDLSEFQNYDKDSELGGLWKQALEAGMLIERNIDELSELMSRIQKGENNEDEFILHINPTMDCNFRCWYCYENHKSGSKMNSSIIDSVKNLIHNVVSAEKIERFDLGFFGGEPLFYFNSIAKELIKFSVSECQSRNIKFHVSFTSNGSLLTNEIVEFLSKFDCGFQITLDGGEEYHNHTRYFDGKIGSYKKIIENIKNLSRHQIRVIVRINYTSENVHSIESIAEEFDCLNSKEKKFLDFDFQRVWQDKRGETDETEYIIHEIRQKFSSLGFTILNNFLLRDVSKPCYGDRKNHVLINYNGDVFGCTAREFISVNRIGVLLENGEIAFDHEIVKKRDASKMSCKVCKKCRIAPICGGGCKQNAVEYVDYDTETCPLGYSDEDINNKIMDLFEYSFCTNTQN